MAYNDNKAYERFQKRIIETLVNAYRIRPEMLVVPPDPPRSLLERWRRGELQPGPHMPMYTGPVRLKRLACLGCGCCRMMPKHLYCEQCLIGRRPWTRGWR